MTIDLKRLQEQRAALAKQMHDLLETAEKDERGFTDEERGQWDSMRTDIEDLDARIELIKEDLQRQSDMDAPANLPPAGGDDGTDDFGVPKRHKKRPKMKTPTSPTVAPLMP